jgi:hypothetical protein
MNSHRDQKDYISNHLIYLDIMRKYPETIPVIIETHHSSYLPQIKNCTFAFERDLIFEDIIFYIRKQLENNYKGPIYLFVNKKLIKNTQRLDLLYIGNKNEHGMLYIQYSDKNTLE